jgi:hypothetical protein
MNTALEYSTRVVQEGGRRCKKSTLNDLVHLTPLRIPLMNPPTVCRYCTFSLGRGRGEEVREKIEGQQYTSILPLSMKATVHKLGRKY